MSASRFMLPTVYPLNIIGMMPDIDILWIFISIPCYVYYGIAWWSVDRDLGNLNKLLIIHACWWWGQAFQFCSILLAVMKSQSTEEWISYQKMQTWTAVMPLRMESFCSSTWRVKYIISTNSLCTRLTKWCKYQTRNNFFMISSFCFWYISP